MNIEPFITLTQANYYILKAKTKRSINKKKRALYKLKEDGVFNEGFKTLGIFGVLSLVLIALSSCQFNKEKIVYIEKTKPQLGISQPQNPQLKDFEFMVIANEEESLICLSQNSYKVLTLNMKLISNFARSQNEVLKKYIDYYEKAENDNSQSK